MTAERAGVDNETVQRLSDCINKGQTIVTDRVSDNTDIVRASQANGIPTLNAVPGMTFSDRRNAFFSNPIEAARSKYPTRAIIPHRLPSQRRITVIIAMKSITTQHTPSHGGYSETKDKNKKYIHSSLNIINKTFCIKKHAVSNISITKVITLCGSNTLHSNRILKPSNSHTLILNQHLSLGMLLLPKPPQTIYLHLVQEKGIYRTSR